VEPAGIVQAADAYHDHDLNRGLGFYAPDVVVKRADGTVVMDRADVVRARYATSMADHPNLHYEPDVVRAVLVYRFEAGLTAEILILT
jgi:hypothetical protein